MKVLSLIMALLPMMRVAAASVMFEKDIRPILKAHCFQCHGESGKTEADLDLRLSRLILKGGENGPAMVPGKPEQSLVFTKVRDGKMPKKQGRLPEHEIAVLRAWIAQGARTARPEPKDPDTFAITEEERKHWAFQLIRKGAVPLGEDNPIDAFILQKLKENRLNFSPEAQRRILIRRATLDLTGLPPTPEEIRHFLENDSPHAYEKLIDRLLASPHYGERWGRHWLDVAGYADSEGYNEKDAEREWAWRYRDYVVRSLNEDMPWNRFIREQIAGDEIVKPPYKDLKPEQVSKLVATGFLRMAPDGTGSGTNDALARNQVMAETLKIISTSIMGLTVGCAQCHDHRHDPIPQRDYYSFRAIFEPGLNPKNWRQPDGRRISLFTDEDRNNSAEIEKKAKLVDKEREKKVKFFIDRTLGWKLEAFPEEAREPLRDAYYCEKRTEEQETLLKRYPSVKQISAGSLYLYDREYNDEIKKLGNLRKKKLRKFLAVAEKKAEAELTTATKKTSIDDLLDNPGEKSQKGISELPKSPPPQAKLKEESLAKYDPEGANELQGIDKRITFFRGSLSKGALDSIAKKAKDIRSKKPEEPFIRVLTEPSGTVPHTHVFYRGNHDQPKETVKPADLRVLTLPNSHIPENDPDLASSGRRSAFAKNLTNGKHPLTARVLVNRFWLHHFGRGIVDTPGDFGRLGEKPSHPELLDWLAADFMANGWQLKRLHRLIMTSRVYRQSSQGNAEAAEKDPDNRLLSRMNFRRMEAETIRDAILSLSGDINLELYGKPVPVMEDEVGQFIIGKENLDGERKPGKTVDLRGAESRRSLYVQVRRSRILSMLDAFDVPAMEPNCDKRSVSTVAPQALIFMNNGFLVQQSKVMAERIQKVAEGNLERQLGLAWEHALAQKPTTEEMTGSLDFVQRQRALFEQGEVKHPELAALANYCQALMSTNRFLYID